MRAHMQDLHVTQENAVFLTDFYELTMAAAYWSNQITGMAAFELYFRRLPVRRSFVLAAGLEQALQYICNVRFTQEQIAWLKRQKQFEEVPSGFFEYLADFRFTGEVWAMPEGTPVFPLEPMLQVHAPIIEAQILETYLLSMINMQSMIATKAARVVRAAGGRGVIDFGSRRAHGPQAGLLAARASYIGGCLGTSNVLAGYLCGIPVFGTAAHSFTMAFPTELDAFRAYHAVFPHNTVLLIDTFDTIGAARKVREAGADIVAVRIDSGNLQELSREVRRILDEDGLHSVKIFVSGDLNEYKIQELVARGAPIDYFGVGTELVTSYDDPALSGVYKLVQTTVEGREVGAFKTSPGKISYPGRKQVYRFKQNTSYSHDQVCLFDERMPSFGSPLLRCYVRDGKLIEELPTVVEARRKTEQDLAQLPEVFHSLSSVEDYPVVFSQGLRAKLAEQVSGGGRPWPPSQ